jgi:hypothetical protein
VEWVIGGLIVVVAITLVIAGVQGTGASLFQAVTGKSAANSSGQPTFILPNPAPASVAPNGAITLGMGVPSTTTLPGQGTYVPGAAPPLSSSATFA